MWCIGVLTAQYRQRMYALLDLYAKPFRASEPVVCVNEKSKQLLGEVRVPLPMKAGAPAKADDEYGRAGTCNLFVAVEPKGGCRTVLVTERRAKVDFVAFIEHLLNNVYATARRAANALLRRVVFHYTPTHGSWLNMAEMEIGILDRQCLDRRLPDRVLPTAEVAAWEKRRNAEQRCIAWTSRDKTRTGR